MNPSGNIYLRVFLPLSAALVLATVLAWRLATSLSIDALEQRLERQLEHATDVLARGAFPFTGELMARLARLLKAEIALIDDGAVAFSTLPVGRTALVAALPRSGAPPSDRAAWLDLELAGVPYKAALRALPTGLDNRYTAVVILASLQDVHAAARRAGLWLGGAALLGLAILAWIGHRIARSITLPIRELADMATRLTAGDRTVRSSLRQTNEIGVLAAALNTLAERLSSYEAEVAEHSRLAAIGQTTARVAHEIRNPLTAIKLHVQLLQEMLPPEQRSITAPLLDEIRRLDLIVSSALDLSRPVKLVTAPVDLNQLAAEVAQLSAAQLAHRGVRLELALAPRLPALTLDAARIKQLLWNLLVNAVDELSDEGVVRLGTAVQPDQVLLTVEDSGPGVAAERRARLFTASASRKPGGFGLGLALCREIVELHGGRIAVDDSELGGAKFSVRLPVTPA